MATRRRSKKASRKKAPASKKSARKKPARGKTASKPARRKAAPRRVSALESLTRKIVRVARRKPARKKTASKPARRKAAPPRVSALEPLARKIVQVTTGDPSQFSFAELYAEGATSTEATGETVTGFAGLEQKLRQWESMQEHTVWKPLNVFLNPDTICIEWDAEVKFRDGRVVNLREIAVHDVKNGKIVAERYYYNPMTLAPPPALANE